MNFYTQQQNQYCGIDLHARALYVCILNQSGTILVHKTLPTTPAAFWRVLAPYREDLVVAVEGIFTWSWLADLCAQEGIAFVLGHALYMKAIPGGKAKNDKIDAHKIAVLLRGGMLPQAYVYPAEMQATRDLRRRRCHLVRKRAEGDLDDDEDSGGHRFEDTVRAAWNRKHAVERTFQYEDVHKGKTYRLAPGNLPFFMHRERGLALDEPEVTIDGRPISASILGTALTLFHTGKAHVERGEGIYFYLPKMESAAEAGFWRDVFAASQEHLDFLRNATIRAIPLIESLPALYQMEEMLFALGPYGAGLNAARWDLQASILEFIMTDPASVWPDRFDVDIKSPPFLTDICRRLVAVCLKRGALPIGGMATALPSKDPAVNQAAGAAIRADKEWEAQQGFIRGWVAHIFHMETAAAPFKALRASGWQPTTEMKNPENYPLVLKVPDGRITIEGTRRNARMLLEYLEGWLNGRGGKGIDTLAGRPGVHPALMEDLATARISVAQTAQRIRHGAKDATTSQAHDFAVVKQLLKAECESIIAALQDELQSPAAAQQAADRYYKALKIAYQWIKNYTDLNYRSLGSYTCAELDTIAAQADAF